jgi:hypothetical protein
MLVIVCAKDESPELCMLIYKHLANHGSSLTYFVLSAATDAGSFNNSVAEQQVGCVLFFSDFEATDLTLLKKLVYGCNRDLFNTKSVIEAQCNLRSQIMPFFLFLCYGLIRIL